MGVNLSEFKSVEMNMTAPRTWTIEQVKDWLTECFGLNPEVHTVGVHALWTKSISNISWYLRPVDDTSKWVSWLKGSERRGTNPVALVLPVEKEVAPPEGGYSGGGGYESGQSSEAPGGGGGYEPEQSSHAEDVYSGHGDGYSGEDGEVDGDEENGYSQNQMEEEDTEGESDADDSDESDDGEEVPIPGRWNHNFSSAMTINDGLDSNWEYHQNNVAVGAMFPSKRHMQDAIMKWAMVSQRQLRTTVSSGKYLTMECVDINCPGRVHGYVPKYDTTWRVSDFVAHSCELASILNDHCNLSSNLIARLLYTEIVEGQAMRVNAIQKNVKKHHFYTISYGKAWRAKQRAMEMRFGSFRDAYDAVVRLLQTLQARNPDTYVNIQDMFLPEYPSYRVLHRVYFSFGVCIESFRHCRPVLCVDGTFLTEMAGRSLLNRDIERAHRAAKLEANPNSLSPMVTRGGNQNWQIHPGWVQRLKWAGLLPFARLVEATRSEVIGERVGTPIKRLQQDHSLLTSLVDRWRPETHTFHFRWGEMAPTLQDVSFLLGLPLAGQPIGPLAEPVLWDEEMPARFEGTRAGQTEFLCEDHGPKCDWLLNFEVSQFTPPMSEAQITRSLEAYILWLLGKVMFTENHQTTINRRFIPIALEIAEAQTADDIIQRSWGSAVLAATYRGLCNACTLVSPKSGLLGCPLFLQLWSWERFPIGRPDIDAERPFGANELADPDHIDMPTFGILWTRRERRFARDQVRNCYPAFTEQFDVLDDRAVIWQPYMAAAVHERYPGGISNLCYRDCAYWMTQSKIIFDVSVEIMAQQRIMRQFGSRQLVDPPPPIAPLPAYVHRYNRKGTSHSSTRWLQRVGSYVAEWDGATTHVWPNDEQFDPQEFAAYLQRYTAATRVRLIPPTDPAQAPPASMHDMYPTQSTAGSRQHAGQLTADLQDEVARYTRQVSSAPLLQRDQHVSWLRRLEDKLRGIYSAITCSRSSDVVQRHLLPPRPSTQQQRRPHLTPTATPRPPPPDRAGGSSCSSSTLLPSTTISTSTTDHGHVSHRRRHPDHHLLTRQEVRRGSSSTLLPSMTFSTSVTVSSTTFSSKLLSTSGSNSRPLSWVEQDTHR
ncbi:hypothetical protein QYE76_051154, partial [Lolium multiflorum]